MRDFIDESLLTTHLFGANSRPRTQVVAGIDNFVVGSDQVWRPHDAIGSCMLDFLPEEIPGRRIAYGVSFGVAALEEADVARLRSLRHLVRRFDALSVREESGVRICEELWGLRAVHVVDPVLLHPADFYEEQFQLDLSRIDGDSSGVACYLLDPSPAKRALCERASRVMGMRAVSVLPEGAVTPSQFRRNPAGFFYPRMREWLSIFSSAGAVVTDSYHGVVLALLFEKPFVAISNARRGASRFESLLKLVGHGERLVPEGSLSPEVLLIPVDWRGVATRLAVHRTESWRFLRRSLAGPGDRYP